MANKYSQNIVLVGFMGVGKSAVGSRLAARLGRKFIDTDEWVEAQAGMRVAEIFARFGEADFRRRERECAEFLATQKNLVIATGGGFFAQLAGAGGANFGSAGANLGGNVGVAGGANSNLAGGAAQNGSQNSGGGEQNAAQNPAQNGVKLGRVIWLKADFDEILRHLNDGAKLGENFAAQKKIGENSSTAQNFAQTAQNPTPAALAATATSAAQSAQNSAPAAQTTPTNVPNSNLPHSAAKKRPLFTDEASAKRLFDARQAGYAAVANLAIDVRGKNANEVAQCILDLIK